MSELGRGLNDVGRGFSFLNAHPRLWGWVAAPAAVTLVVLTALVILVLRIADSLVGRVTSWLPDAIANVGGWVLWVIVLAALVFGALIVFVSVAGIVAGPFNEMLSEAVEREVTGKPSPDFSFGSFMTSLLRGIGHGIKRVIVAVLGAIMLFAIGFVPVIGTIAALLLGFYFTSRGAAYDCYDSILSRRDMAYDAKTAYLAANRSRTFGLGAAVAGMLMVPVLNLVSLGVGAAGATLAVLEADGKIPHAS